MKHPVLRFVFLALFAALAPAALAQSGKIAGRVTDGRSGEALPGVNIVVDGTPRGAASDIDGYYTILGVSPGTVRIRATYLGYAPQLVENVRVSIDQTTTLNLTMREEAVEGQEIIVTATRPVVEADVSSSRANITAEQVEAVPVASITGVVALQAGIQSGASGIEVRGSSADQLQFNLNGLTLRDERTNTAYTAIPLSSVQEIQVVTGGFNAEYGNVRSGVINVVTKEGDRDTYNVDASIRYSPPGAKSFGAQANDLDSYWIRPFTDPAVAFVGTKNGAWDTYTQQQFPEFQGWLSVSERLLADADPSNDLTPDALYQAFLYQHRKRVKITQPDYNADIGFGGPVPLLNRVGDTRFYAAYKRDQSVYLIPLSRDRYLQQTFTGKVTSDVGNGMKLSVETLYGNVTGTASSRIGQPGIFSSAGGITGELTGTSFIDARIFGSDYWAPTRTRDFMLGAKFTHALNDKTFYELRATRYASAYDTNPGRLRDTTKTVFFGGVGFDEGPFGFQPNPSNGVDGMRMGVGLSNARDTSRVVVYNFKGDVTRQLNRFLEAKTGFEANVTDSRINFGSYDAYLPSSNFVSAWDRAPQRGAAYLQTKLEFKGMIANTGLRLDYSHAGGEWYAYDPFSPNLSAFSRLDTSAAEATRRIVSLSPRLGVSFPVTQGSKLFFNYGHFRSLPLADALYQVRIFSANDQVTRIADPNAPLPKTVAYELGYEQSLFEQFLVRVAGYYKNVSLESRDVSYVSNANRVSYTRSAPNSYADIRGFEFTVERNRGRWLRGFVNYTYMVETSGRFGFPEYSDNPSRQREIERSDALRRNSQSKPVPRPFARVNVDLLVPQGFGPRVAGARPLENWRVSLLGSWRAGSRTTWIDGGGSREDVLNNLQFVDVSNLDLRFSRDFRFASRKAQFFVDVNNALNQRRMSTNGFVDGNDSRRYFTSLHLPKAEKAEYSNIVGDDRPGTFRKAGVAYQPMLAIADRATQQAPDASVIYFERASGEYLVYANGAWGPVDRARLDRVMEDKAYIDMPNQSFLTFLNPRDVFFGFRINL